MARTALCLLLALAAPLLAASPTQGQLDESVALVKKWLQRKPEWKAQQPFPTKNQIPAFVESARRNLVDVRGIGLVLSRLGPSPDLPVAELLGDNDRDARLRAAILLEMIGPETEDALPALESVMNDPNEDVEVRVRAARAMASISNQDGVDLTPGMEMAEKDDWIFASNGDAYMAVKIVKGCGSWTNESRTRIMMKDQYSPIIIQTGRAFDYGSFDVFGENTITFSR